MRAAPTATGGCAPPEYPPESAQNGETGAVTIHLWYTASGTLARTKIVESSGFPRLDDAVRAAFERCRFAQVFGTGRAVDQEIEYAFRRD
jgi:protein TonB